MNHPLPAEKAIDQMLSLTPEQLLIRELAAREPENRIVHRAWMDRITLEREQALERVKALEEECNQIRKFRTAATIRAIGWPLATLLSVLCTYFLAR